MTTMERLTFGQEEPAELGIISVAEGVMLLLAAASRGLAEEAEPKPDGAARGLLGLDLNIAPS